MCTLTVGSDLSICQFNETLDGTICHAYKTMVDQFIPDSLFTMVLSMIPNYEYNPWIFSMIGSTIIGLSGVFPLLVIPIEEGENLSAGGSGAQTLKVLLSFAVGCLLGDVFLHLLPEVWANELSDQEASSSHPSMNKGLWVLAGLLIFIVLEKAFACMQEGGSEDSGSKETQECEPKEHRSHCNGVANGYMERLNNNEKETPVTRGAGYTNGHCKTVEDVGAIRNGNPPRQRTTSIHVSGYLNLMANSFDNFTHGLAVGGSFLVSFPHGVLTTFAILLHEIPHEVGDFAILLRSGFSRWEAAKAQICTAFTGILGAVTSVALSGASGTVEARTSWILPFTAGGFLHIALVTVLPDLLKEENPKESLLQLASLLSGIGIMAALNILVEE